MKYLLILSSLLFTSVGWSKDVNSDDLIKSKTSIKIDNYLPSNIIKIVFTPLSLITFAS